MLSGFIVLVSCFFFLPTQNNPTAVWLRLTGMHNEKTWIMRTVKNGVIHFCKLTLHIYIYTCAFDADLIMLGGVSENSTCYDVLAGFEWQLTAVCKWHEDCLQPTCVCQMTDINSTAFISFSQWLLKHINLRCCFCSLLGDKEHYGIPSNFMITFILLIKTSQYDEKNDPKRRAREGWCLKFHIK